MRVPGGPVAGRSGRHAASPGASGRPGRRRGLLALIVAVAACRGPQEAATRPPEAAAPPPATAAASPPEGANSPPVWTFAEVERGYHEALARDARDRRAFEGLARLYYDRGIAGEAGYLLLAERVVDQGERALAAVGQASAELAVTRGLLRLGEGRPDLARRAFLAALEVDPAHAAAALAAARIEVQARDPAAALAHLEIAGRDPSLALAARLAQGAAHVVQDDLAAAEAALVAATGLAPDDPRTHHDLGVVLALRFFRGDESAYDAGGRARDGLSRYIYMAAADPAERGRIARARVIIDTIDELRRAPLCTGGYNPTWRMTKEAREAEEAERRRLLDLERQALEASPAE